MSKVGTMDYVWLSLITSVFACIAFGHIRTAFTSRFSYWRRKPDGGMWPPARSRNPIRFWLLWAILAIPILYICALLVAGFLIMAFGR